jgi:hypothetical protein
MFINRFFRYFPALAVAILIAMHSVDSERHICSNSWKDTLFLTQNFNKGHEGNVSNFAKSSLKI